MDGADRYDDDCGGKTGGGSDEADASIGSFRDASPCGQQASGATDCLADLGRDGIGGGFGQCGKGAFISSCRADALDHMRSFCHPTRKH